MKHPWISLLLILSLSISSTFAQDLSGKWYDHNQTNGHIELIIHQENDQLRGSYNSVSENGINVIDGPVEAIVRKGDSLILDIMQSGYRLVYKLQYHSATDSYNGARFFRSRKGPAVSLRRGASKKKLSQSPRPKKSYTKLDSLRGSITPERAWWDLTYYNLKVKVEPETKYISGKNSIQYRVLKSHDVLQVDLQPPLVITKVVQDGQNLDIRREGNAHYIHLKSPQEIGMINSIEVSYKGHPKEAVNPPWDGGFTWHKDPNGNHFIATTCQGIGASIWWPNKDHMYDEVDSMHISVTIPKGLTNISNGRLQGIRENPDNTVTSTWFVSNPINNYGVNVNIGDYVHFSEVYQGEKGPLDMDYYVLRDNLEKAKVHFSDAPRTMQAFEHWFGPYPFYEDGFKLVEVPYFGMEHQSSVTYGNNYKKGMKGVDRTGTGWALKFDYIIIHETGHEWFANNITYKDMADMWVHEGFTTYSENLFLDYHYGRQAASEYVIGSRKGIRNDEPIIGDFDVNRSGSGDMYVKGSNMLHTLRYIIGDDEKWRHILRGLNSVFYHQTVTGQQVESYIAEQAGMDLKPFFDQYLRTVQIPTLEYYVTETKIVYRWINTVAGFDMPLRIFVGGEAQWIYPKMNWTHHHMEVSGKDIKVDPNFYVGIMAHTNASLKSGAKQINAGGNR
jgi:aminopeptidase N